MSEHHAFASLSPRLLARKGAAKPAMRRQDTVRLVGGGASSQAEDLGWNDWGHGEEQGPGVAAPSTAKLPQQEIPEVLRQIEELAWRINRAVVPPSDGKANGRRTAFTLRLDAERQFRLRMAGVILNRSAQVLVTEALDKYLSEIPGIAHLQPAPEKGR